MNFEFPEDVKRLQQATRAFIREEVLPMENDPRQDEHGPQPALRAELVERARKAGLLTPHASAMRKLRNTRSSVK